MNDRYADLALAANFFVPTEADEDAYLAAYFAAPPTDYHRARFFLARWINHLSYVALLSFITARAAIPPQPTPDFRTFHAGLIANTIDLSAAETKVQYANAHLAAARDEMQSP